MNYTQNTLLFSYRLAGLVRFLLFYASLLILPSSSSYPGNHSFQWISLLYGICVEFTACLWNNEIVLEETGGPEKEENDIEERRNIESFESQLQICNK